MKFITIDDLIDQLNDMRKNMGNQEIVLRFLIEDQWKIPQAMEVIPVPEAIKSEVKEMINKLTDIKPTLN